MPIELVPPKTGRSPNYRIRGTYLGHYVDKTCGTPVKKTANEFLKATKKAIEEGRIERDGDPTFAMAAEAYLDAGGEERFIEPLNAYFGETLIKNIDQIKLDKAAKAIYPDASPATRNRQVYTPVVAILARAGIERRFKRPKGAQGRTRTDFLEPEEAWRVIAAAEEVDAEMAVALTCYLYTGLRKSEALDHLLCSKLSLAKATAFVGHTKNGDPRAVHLPPALVAALADHPRGLDRGDERVFRWTRTDPALNKEFYALLHEIYAKAGVDHKGEPIHIMRHSYATWMGRYAGADPKKLVDAQVWKDIKSASRYSHTAVNEAAVLADKLPTRAKPVRKAG